MEWFVKNQHFEWVEVKSYYEKLQDRLTFDRIDYKIIIPKKDVNQETLEEAVIDYIKNTSGHLSVKNGFMASVKWQTERMYSERDILDAWELGAREGLPLTREKKRKII